MVNNMFDFTFLDTVWKLLVTLTISSSLLVIFCLIESHLIRRQTTKESLRRLYNLNSLLILSFVMVGGLIIALLDPEILTSCFSRFAASSEGASLTRMLSACYSIGVLFLALKNFWSFYRMNQKQQKLQNLTDSRIHKIVDSMKRELNLDQYIRVCLDQDALSPYVSGVFSFNLVVNPYLVGNSDENKVKAVIGHELMHIQRFDSFWILSSFILKHLFFYNPMFHIFYRLHRSRIELSADERALKIFDLKSSDLGLAIVEIAELGCQKSKIPLCLTASQGFRDLKERLEAMNGHSLLEKNWMLPVISSASVIFFVIALTIQTKASTFSKDSQIAGEPLMCSQAEHEKFMESLIKKKEDSNKCE